MTPESVLSWISSNANAKTRTEMSQRYGIPNDNAFGVPMGEMKKFARTLGKDHALAADLWASGSYESRTIAVLVEDPNQVTKRQMDAWVRDFDSWAICDTACFSLFDQVPFAWQKVKKYATAKREFVRRAAFALMWALSVHDKQPSDAQFCGALELIAAFEPDDRPLVTKAVDMALRAIGKRNRNLNAAAIKTAAELAADADKTRAWIGRHALKELQSSKVRSRLKS